MRFRRKKEKNVGSIKRKKCFAFFPVFFPNEVIWLENYYKIYSRERDGRYKFMGKALN